MTQTVTIIRITAKRPGFCRAGMAHAAGPIDHPVEDFTDEQLKALRAEPMLVVETIELEPVDQPPSGNGDGDGQGSAAQGTADGSSGSNADQSIAQDAAAVPSAAKPVQAQAPSGKKPVRSKK